MATEREGRCPLIGLRARRGRDSLEARWVRSGGETRFVLFFLFWGERGVRRRVTALPVGPISEYRFALVGASGTQGLQERFSCLLPGYLAFKR